MQFQNFPSEKNLFLFFREEITHLTLYIAEKCFELLATKLGCFEPYVTENSVSPLLCLKYPAFNFIAGKVCLP